MANKDFIIENNSLIKYAGNDSKVVIPEGVVKIEGEAFRENSNITNVVFPTTLVEIGWSAFEKCSHLRRIMIPENVKTLGHSCFRECEKLRSVVVSAGVKNIDDLAFASCKNLKSAVILDKMCKIGDEVFAGCVSLEELVLPPNCKLGILAFNEKGTIPNSLVSSFPTLYRHLSDSDLAETVNKYIRCIDCETIAEIFITRLKNKPIPRRINRQKYYEFFRVVIWTGKADEVSQWMIKKLPPKATKQKCTSVACALVLLSQKVSVDILKKIYLWLIAQTANEEALQIIKEDPSLAKALNIAQ